MKIAIVIAARDEEETIAAVVRAALAAAATTGATVLVVANNCTDDTAERARAAGADVVVRDFARPSKAAAVVTGIVATDADVICMIDADCVGITSRSIVGLIEPVADGRATMATLVFDYGPHSWLVECFPWSTGQRAFRTEVFRLGDPRLDGYNLELLINEWVGAHGGLTVSVSQTGLHHRTKLEKSGIKPGFKANRKMWSDIAHWSRTVDREAYRRYAYNVVVDYDARWVPPPRWLVRIGLLAMSAAASVLRWVWPHDARPGPRSGSAEVSQRTTVR